MFRNLIACLLLACGASVFAAAAPVAQNQTVSFVQGVPSVTFSLLLSDADTSYRDLTVIIVSSATNGTLSFPYPTSPSYGIYTPSNTTPGTYKFTWKGRDPGGLVSSVATVTIVVLPNQAPVATSQVVNICQGTASVFFVLSANDPDGTPFSNLTFPILSSPTKGTLSNLYSSNPNYFTYTPLNPMAAGTDSFTYKVRDPSGLESQVATVTINTALNTVPTVNNQRLFCYSGEDISASLSYTDPDTQTRTFTVLKQPVHGSFTTPPTSGSFVYHPNPGFTGSDFFTWQVNDGLATSNTATCSLMVRAAPDQRSGDLVLVIVNTNLLTTLTPEINRLRQDLVDEGYSAKIVSMSGTTSVTSMWTYLKSEWTNPTQSLVGAVLIGSLPKAKTGSAYNDLPYWCLRTAAFPTTDIYDFDIWVSRIISDGTTYGSEAQQVRRALDANHAYRKGISRLPHTAYYFYCFDTVTSTQASVYLETWPEVKYGGGGNHGVSFEFLADRPDVNHAACDAYVVGGEIFDETSHGNADGYMEGRWFEKNACYRLLIQQRFVMVDSCSSGALGGIANQQLFTRGGGMVYAVGGTELNYNGDFTLRYNPTGRSLLSKGESWGRTLLKNYGFYARNRTIHYGDLSIAALGNKNHPAFPANEIPKITDLTASATSIKPGESVNFTVNFSDPDAATSDNPAVNYEHLIEWFPAGYNSGRATPTQTLTLNGATSTIYSYTYPTPGIYVARVEVTDEWMARGWKEVTITVNNPPVANLDTVTVVAGQSATIAVLTNDTDADGQALTLVKVLTSPVHGTTKIVGSNIIYTCKDAIWTGTETFTYQIKDTLGVTADGIISVTVVSGQRDRLIEMNTVPGTVWFATEPADAITDAPTSSTQAIHLRRQQSATLKLNPGSIN